MPLILPLTRHLLREQNYLAEGVSLLDGDHCIGRPLIKQVRNSKDLWPQKGKGSGLCSGVNATRLTSWETVLPVPIAIPGVIRCQGTVLWDAGILGREWLLCIFALKE